MPSSIFRNRSILSPKTNRGFGRLSIAMLLRQKLRKHTGMAGTKTRVFFATDVHGSNKCFRKFVNAAKFYQADVLVLGGDITGKMIVPIVEDSNGYSCSYMGSDTSAKTKEDLDALIRSISDSGYYPYVTTKAEVDELWADKKKIEELFTKLMVESIDSWVKIAYERLAGTNVKCYISPGNDDILAIDSHLVDNGVVINPEAKVVRIDDDHEMITLGTVNRTPWNSPREVDEDKLEAMLEEMCGKVQNMKNCLFNIHCPPISTVIDQAPALDGTLRPIIKGGKMEMTSAGSLATRHVIEKYQPLTGIHGHIHEIKGMVKIGNTVCFNPGSEYQNGLLKGLLLTLEDSKIKSYMFTTG